jgi:hypothetical protein
MVKEYMTDLYVPSMPTGSASPVKGGRKKATGEKDKE